MKRKVLILGGGISKERLISLETAKEVFKELIKQKYKVLISEPDKNLIKKINIFKPDIISVEYLDLKMNNLEFKNNNLNSLINSDLYKYLLNKNYIFVNWIHGDVIFVNKSFRN